jgi:hypothetical protein
MDDPRLPPKLLTGDELRPAAKLALRMVAQVCRLPSDFLFNQLVIIDSYLWRTIFVIAAAVLYKAGSMILSSSFVRNEKFVRLRFDHFNDARVVRRC